VKIFAERGYGSTSVRDIAERARIRVSTLYHYFRSKDDMYGEVQRRVDLAVRDIVVSCLDEDLEFRDLVQQLIEKLFDFLLAHRDEARLAFEARLGRVATGDPGATREWVGLAEGVLRPAAARGLLTEIDPVLFIISMDGLLHWHVVNEAAYRRNGGRDLSDAETAERVKHHIVQMTLRGLGIE
jgi:AcrR family transcriptional regulator